MDNENTEPLSVNQKSVHLNSSSFFEGSGSSMPLPSVDFSETSGDLFETQRDFMFLELQHLIDLYDDAFCHLNRMISHVVSLREENLLLSSEKLKLLSLVQDQERSSSVVTGLDGANLEMEGYKGPIAAWDGETAESVKNAARGVLLKSISIRSSGFLAARHLSPRGSKMSTIRSRQPLRLRLPAKSEFQDGGVEGEVEVEAYSQGMTKTELCNKWGEMGWCPYAERCQFAHGIHELRPVIRHPRYKTQLCRMLTAGGGCPYGHRCHFRHAALTNMNNH